MSIQTEKKIKNRAMKQMVCLVRRI